MRPVSMIGQKAQSTMRICNDLGLIRGSTRLLALTFLSCLSLSTARAALPPVPTPAGNPITEDKRVLGKMLFWDEQLSTSNVVSCGTCHVPANAGADDRLSRRAGLDGLLNTADDILGSAGVIRSDADNDYVRDLVFALRPQITARAANSPINAAFSPLLFWDGRASGQFRDPVTNAVVLANGGALESQAVGPIVNDVEMAHADTDWAEVTSKLRRVQPMALGSNLPTDIAARLASRPSYPQLFQSAFGDSNITAARIGMAIATYQRTLISNQAPFDAFRAGVPNAMTPRQVQGFNAFTASNCAVCHATNNDLFTNHTFRNVGLRPPAEDLGRQIVTGDVNDRGKFKVPGLRNVGLKRTFMHNGQFQTLGQVVDFYARAQGAAPQFEDNRDQAMNNVNVPPPARNLIIDFLANGLTDPRVANQTFPFDKPTLFVDRSADQSVILGGGQAGPAPVPPAIIVQAPPLIGNMEYRIGLDADAALAGLVARLAVSTSPPVNGRITPEYRFAPITLTLDTPAGGATTVKWPIRPGAKLDGQIVYTQWFITNPLLPPGSAAIARSAVAQVTFFCADAPLGCPDVCPGEFDGNGTVDLLDLLSFLNEWTAESPGADVNPILGVDLTDLLHFLDGWVTNLGQSCD